MSATASAAQLAQARAALQAGAAKVALPHAQLGVANRAPAEAQAGVLALGHEELDALLPDGGFAWGQVVELCSAIPSYATSLSMLVCARAQQAGLHGTGQAPWCAFVDSFASLYAPGVAQAGVDLDRLLVVRPPVATLARISSRLIEARAFAVVVVDTVALAGGIGKAEVDLGKWTNVVRRFSSTVTGTQSLVILITDANAERPLPLPVGMRIDLRCTGRGSIKAQLSKERQGRITSVRSIECHDFTPDLLGAMRAS